MVNIKLLKAKSAERGINFSELGAKINRCKSTFYRRLANGELTIKDLRAIKETLQLTIEEFIAIFFSEVVA